MYFFINSALNKQNSGIEHAQIQRAHVFRQYKMPFRLLYTNWNPQMTRWLKSFDLTSRETLTMFDYYQGTQVVDHKKITPKDIFLSDGPTEFKPVKGQNCYEVYPGAPIMGRIRWFDNMPNGEKQVSMVERFDIYGNLYRVDEYDVRGFLSRSQFYTPDNKVYMLVWFDLNGRPVITQNISQNREKEAISDTWELVDRQGRRHFYQTFRDLVAKWLDDLNNQFWDKDEPNYFVGDRMEGYEDAMMGLTRPAIRISHIHNSHGADVHDEMHSLLNNYYEYDLYNNDRYDFYIAATHKQTHDMQKRFNLPDRVVAIPVGLTTPQKRVPMSDRKFGSVLVTARRAEEKQIDKIIRMVGMAHQEVPEVSLDVYGYRDRRNHDAAKKKMDQAIKDYQAQDYVHIHDYDPDLDKQRDNHQIYVVFSTMEGFNIALMEAQNHGEVAIANDVNYGPNELTVDGQNGYVVGYDDVKAGAEKLVKLFKDPDLMQKLSDGAYDLSDRYSAKSIHDGWMTLINRAEKMWNERTRRDLSVTGLEEIDGLDASGLNQKDVQVQDNRTARADEVKSQMRSQSILTAKQNPESHSASQQDKGGARK